MQSVNRRNRYAMSTTVSSAVLLLAGVFASAAFAADQVVAQGTTEPNGVMLAPGDSLTNNGTITHNGGRGVDGLGAVTFILNTQTGEISSVGDVAIDINGALGTLDNAGTITADGWTTIYLNSGVGEFINSGSVTNTGTGRAVEINLASGGVNSFTNSGTIAGGTDNQGVAFFNNAHRVGSFTNSGTITGGSWETVGIEGGVDSFINAASGTIRNTGRGGAGDGHGVAFNTGTVSGGQVGSFENHGTIIADLTGGGGNGVGFFDGGDATAHQVGRFVNTGTINGNGNAVGAQGGFGTFANDGTITSVMWQAVRSGGDIGTFTNSGRIVSEQDRAVGIAGNVGTFTNSGYLSAEQHNAVNIDGTAGSVSNSGSIVSGRNGFSAFGFVNSFANSGSIVADRNGVILDSGAGSVVNSGRIEATTRNALWSDGDIADFTNSGLMTSLERTALAVDGTIGSMLNTGTIRSRDQSGVYVQNSSGTFVNRGTIEGYEGVVLDGNGHDILINSGTIRGTNNAAIMFNGGDDLLQVETGSKIFGAIEFGAGDDAIDVSGFAGNALFNVFDLDHVVAGTRMVHFDQPNDLLAVVETTGVTQGSQPAVTGLAMQLTGLVSPVLDNALATDAGGVEPLGYAPLPQTAADLAIVNPPAKQATIWATAIGGGSHDAQPIDIGSVYGALVAGTHAMLAPQTTLGVMGAVGSGRVNVNGGGQIVDNVTGIAGVYGRHDAGAVTFDFSLLGGVAGNESAREVAAPGGMETARASYGSWFIVPSVGIAIPVLNTETGEVDLVGALSYVGGQAAGYTETGSSVNLTVGQQSISLLDARIGLAGTFDIGNDGAKATARGGVFVQSNLGGTSVPVTFLGQTQNAAVAGTTDTGLYGGLGFSVPAGQLTLSANADAQWRLDGQVGGAIRLGAKADF